MNPLLVLAEPGRFKERDVQDALEALWPCLSLYYPILIRPGAIMPNTWRPDMVAVNKTETACLVIELKGIPPFGSKKSATSQVLGYASELQRKYRKLNIQPVLIGPYARRIGVEYVHRKGYDVIVVNLRRLGKYLIDAAVTSMIQQGRDAAPDALGCLDVMLLQEEADTS